MIKVLLVDDSKVFQKILTRVLNQTYEVVGTASDGLDGFGKYKELKPDFVLLDITMPNCNGKECLEMIIKDNPQAKVIMCSSLGDELTIQQCYKIGALGFIPKDLIKLNDQQQCPEVVDMIKGFLASQLLKAQEVA